MQRNLPNFSVGSSRVALVGMRHLLLSVQAWKQFLSHANYILSSRKDAEEVIKAKQNALFRVSCSRSKFRYWSLGSYYERYVMYALHTLKHNGYDACAL
jgi:hypothetical protein